MWSALAAAALDPDLFDICDDHDFRCRFDVGVAVFGHRWPACPHELLRHPAWRYVVTLDAMLLAAPHSGWPDAFSAWVVDGVLALRRARAAKAHREATNPRRVLGSR